MLLEAVALPLVLEPVECEPAVSSSGEVVLAMAGYKGLQGCNSNI